MLRVFQSYVYRHIITVKRWNHKLEVWFWDDEKAIISVREQHQSFITEEMNGHTDAMELKDRTDAVNGVVLGDSSNGHAGSEKGMTRPKNVI